jgi:hypothetical protein
MKVRITQPGFENYTGQIGVVHFVDGMSIEDVPRIHALRLSAVMNCEGEDGSSLSLVQEAMDKYNDPAPEVAELFDTEGGNQEQRHESAIVSAPAVQDHEQGSQAPAKSVVYTRAQLEAIADEKGIKGLRAITDELDIKGNSIAGIITQMVYAGYATE